MNANRMLHKVILAGLLIGGLNGSGYTASQKGKDQILREGAYSATVNALVCEACGPKVQETLQKVDGIQSVTVDQEKKTVKFMVKKSAKIKLTDLQKILRASSLEMGMGDDYQIKGLKNVG